MAYKARQQELKDQIIPGDPEGALDAGFLYGLNWAILSQQYSVTQVHVDTAGVFTAISMLSGSKIWAIRRTLLDGKGDHPDVDDAEYFVELGDRDLKDLPGGEAAWISIVLFAGDVLCVLIFLPFGSTD